MDAKLIEENMRKKNTSKEKQKAQAILNTKDKLYE